MNKVQAAKLARTASYLVGGGSAGIFGLLSMVNPRNAPIWAAASGALISVGGLLGIWFPPPAPAVVKDAPVYTADGKPTGATNISSSSDVFARKEAA